jgi:hypothetical protein
MLKLEIYIIYRRITMKRKLQVFISSTFKDLIEERQAAVEAVIEAGHIPAGMELFKAGDETQKETIQRWIQDSDVYLLLLGGRYGSIEPSTQKSYTQWEYEYAGEIGKPRFALVMQKQTLDKKVKEKGPEVLELDSRALYDDFRKDVLSRTSQFFEDCKDIKYSISRKMIEFHDDENLVGWVSGKDVTPNTTLANYNAKLAEENMKLKEELHSIKSLLSEQQSDNDIEAEELEILDDDFGLSERNEFEDRLERILLLKNITPIETTSYSTMTIRHNNSIFNIPYPHGDDLEPYYLKDDNGVLKKLIIIGIGDYPSHYDGLLGDIRVSLSKYDDKKDMINVEFILAMPGNQPNRREHFAEFTEKISKENVLKNRENFQFEFWDEEKLRTVEKQLLLTT